MAGSNPNSEISIITSFPVMRIRPVRFLWSCKNSVSTRMPGNSVRGWKPRNGSIAGGPTTPPIGWASIGIPWAS